MPIFYEKAIRVGVNGDSIDWLRQEHLADWNGLANALDYLTPEQRCDAIYADWLLRLNENRTLILPIRDYLIGQGALSANYLAELAQNADDAADGVEAEIRIIPNGEWLFVSNNGRKITSLNLLGLSRFFVHSADRPHPRAHRQRRQLDARLVERRRIAAFGHRAGPGKR
jgi:hypothetical protein